MLKTTRLTAAIAIPLAAAAGLWTYQRADAHDAPQYRYAAVTQGNLQSTVSATGTLGAVTTVQVGTQVSGQVSAIYADFNQKVKKGQLLARIDPTLANQAVQDAAAGVEKAQAQYAQANDEYQREKQLRDQGVVTATEFGTAQENYTVAAASLKSAQIALDRARQNLAYTNIYAPIDGIVVERNVDVGQTVAASLSAPQLFLIANDLSQMQILAAVDESDIGSIQQGQPVKFTVQSYPNQTFSGVVQQVRLQSTTQDNVVNYTVVVAVQNPDGKLLPGMTATVQFLTGSATNVLEVPNAALRFRPSADMLAAAGITQPATGASRSDTSRKGAAGTGTSRSAQGATAGKATSGTTPRAPGATLWYVGKNGALAMTRVRTGLTDGQSTEVSGSGIAAGMQVIIGAAQPGQATTPASSGAARTTNPFQPQGGGSRRPGGF